MTQRLQTGATTQSAITVIQSSVPYFVGAIFANAERIALLTAENRNTTKALNRKRLLESVTDPIAPHKLKNHIKIAKLHNYLLYFTTQRLY